MKVRTSRIRRRCRSQRTGVYNEYTCDHPVWGYTSSSTMPAPTGLHAALGILAILVSVDAIPMEGAKSRLKRDTDVIHISEKEGRFVSPGYPTGYPSEADLQYVFDTTLKIPYRITLNYSIDIEFVAGCAFDQLVFRYQPVNQPVNLTSLCGEKSGTYTVVIQDGDTFSAYFKSDASVQKKGFAISFKMEEARYPRSWENFLRLKHFPLPSAYSNLPNGRSLTGGGAVIGVGGAPVYTNEVTGNKGIFLSPNYPQNYPELVNYTYIAHLEGYGPYVVHVEYKIDLEYFKPCLFDFVTLGDQRYCGVTSGSIDIPVQGNEFRVFFYSDNAITKSGFNISYTATPNSVLLRSRMLSTNLGGGSTVNSIGDGKGSCSQPLQSAHGNFGQISSPNYPDNYTNSCDLAYFVVLDQPGPQSVMVFVDMDLEDSTRCSKDYLVINEVAQYLCGQKGKISLRVNLVDTSFVIKFHSDKEGTRRGFFITYFLLLASPTSSTSLPLPQPRSPTARSVVSLRGDSGQLQSPSYPANYPNNAFVVYDVALRQRGNYTVLLTYDLDVEESDDCTYDYILVIADQRHRLCGKRSGVLAVQTNYNFSVIFVSDYSVTQKGFNITYRVLRDQTVVVGDWGQLQSPQYPSQYPTSLDITYYIKLSRPGPQTVLLSYDMDIESSVECSYDYLIVNNNAVKRLCSVVNGIIPVQVENNLLVVVFHSDYSVTGRGFNLVYSVVQADQPGATGDQNLVPFTSPSVSTSITTRFIIPQIETIDVFYPQTGSSGIIKSPGFPSSYTNKLDTTSVVSLDPTRPQLVTFTFDTFDLELCDDCQCDWLEIDVDPAQRFCGDVLDKKSLTVLVQKASLEVKFHSDYSITGRGFLATYSAVSA